MEKKQYIAPLTERVEIEVGNILITASPGVGGDYDPNLPIDAKRGFFDDEETLFDDDEGIFFDDVRIRLHSLWED